MKTVGAIIILILIAVGIVYWAGGAQKSNQNNNKETQVNTANSQQDLKIEDLKVGDGAEAKDGSSVSVNYLGTLTDGTKFDSSYDRSQPFEFTIGQGQVIQGWEQGVVGMKVGGKRKLTIPPSLGYGDQAVGPIPASSTLIFEIELLDVK